MQLLVKHRSKTAVIYNASNLIRHRLRWLEDEFCQSVKKSMRKRIIGLDVARALAVIGMIVVNFKVVFGEEGDSWLKPLAHFFEGKAAATFVILAGVGLALTVRRALDMPEQEQLRSSRRKIVRRAVFLFRKPSGYRSHPVVIGWHCSHASPAVLHG